MAKKRKPAVYFLGIVAILVFITVSAVAIFNTYPWQVMSWAYVPNTSFADQTPPRKPDYYADSSWFALPQNPAEAAMQPGGQRAKAPVIDADVFFIHPTTYLKAKSWNGPIDDPDADKRSRLMVMKNQASAFNGAGRIIAPKYRQATFGSFLALDDGGTDAIYAAQADILAAFDVYMADMNEGRPFIIAGHSQGALHGLMLLKNRIAGTALAKQLVAAYLIGWPIGRTSDIGALDDIDICTSADDTGCVISWQSFAPDGDPSYLRQNFEKYLGLDGKPRRADDMLCTNPLNWEVDGSAPASANLGALPIFETAEPLPVPEPELVGATCRDGYLFMHAAPQHVPWQSMLLPDGNYHVHDINLFYMNVGQNAVSRVLSFTAKQASGEIQ